MYYVGIDIAKQTNVVCIIDENEAKVKKPFKVESSHEAYETFVSALEELSSNRADFLLGLEATGVYGENLLEFLRADGFDVKLLNPFQVSRYREHLSMKKVKNDNIDAMVIALLIKDGKFSSGYVTDEAYQSLRTLYRDRTALQEDAMALKKRIRTLLAVTFPEFETVIDPFSVSGTALLQKYPTAWHYHHSSVERILKLFRHIKGNNFNADKAQTLLMLAKNSIYSGKAHEARAVVMRSSLRLLALYQGEIAALEAEIRTFFEAHPPQQPDADTLVANLRTIPGVSDKTIAAILSECGDLTRFGSVSKFIGYLGLFPTQEQSGNTEKAGHLSKRGSSQAKHALYMSAVSALLHNDQLKQLYDTKRSQGKSKKEALIAVSRKLATIIYAIFRTNTPYDPARVFTIKS